MQLKTILNHVERHKSFVYQEARFVEGKTAIEIPIEPRANGRAICSGCGRRRPGYDRLPARRFEYVPLWQIPVFFVYAMRRVDCPDLRRESRASSLGRRQEPADDDLPLVPGGLGKTVVVEGGGRGVWHDLAERVSLGRSTRCWWGLAHRDLEGIEAIGVDEVAWQKGHKYLTLVYQIDEGCKRLLWIGQDRTEASFRKFFEMLGRERSGTARSSCAATCGSRT